MYSIAERKLQTLAGQFSTCFGPQNKKKKIGQKPKILHTLLLGIDAMQMKTSFDPTKITGYESVDLVNCGAGKQELIKCLVKISIQEARLRLGFNSCNVNCFSVDFDIIWKER